MSTAGRRRTVYGFRTGVLLFALTACCVFVGLLGSKASARLDVTVTRQHRLSQRTLDVLARLDKPYEVVIAADPRTLDQATWQRTADVLDAFSHASRNVNVTVLNTGQASGVEKFDALMGRLAERYKARSDAAAAGIENAAVAAERLADAIESLSAPLLKVRESLAGEGAADPAVEKARANLESRAAMARVKAEDLRTAVKAARAALARKAAPVPLPPTDEAARMLREQLAEAAGSVSLLNDDLRSPAMLDKIPVAARELLAPIASEAIGLRDRAARAVTGLDAVPHPPLLRAARALQQNTAALVIAPPDVGTGPGVTAIDLDSLLPVRVADANAGPAPDIRFRAEDLIASAIVSLSSPSNPIVVFVHALPRTLGPDFRDFGALMDRLHLRGMDVAEWSAATEADPPSPVRMDPTGKRPIVYVVVTVPAITPDAAARMGKLSNAVARLINLGQPVLLSVAPSTLPAYGTPDPMTAFLAPLGITAESGKPILRQGPTPTGRGVYPDHVAEPVGGEHPLARALRGLRTPLVWPCQIEQATTGAAATASTVVPILSIPASADVWAESEWLDFAQNWPRQPPGAKLPSPGGPRNVTRTSGSWTVALAAERVVSGKTAPQRLVVVGSYGWFSDQFARLIAPQADAASVFRTIGNLELFEASVYWLAGQDELIAQSAASQSVARIPPMSAGQASVLRWSLVLGLPLLVLVAGASWRMLRG